MIEPVSKDKCLPEILALFPDLIAHRHDIHQHPDCGFETQRTIGKIKEFLEKHNVSSKDMDDATCPGSLFVEIKGNLPGKTIGFRADIDALKMKDKSEKEWTSKIDGHAHACGHDGHQTWLMGAAAYMAEHRDFPGSSKAPKKPAKALKASSNPASWISTTFKKCMLRTTNPS